MLSKRLTEKGSVLPTKLRELKGNALEEAELKQVNAIRTLLDNRYKQKVGSRTLSARRCGKVLTFSFLVQTL